MITVSNTSPIINLAAISQLSLLQQLYGNIVIAQAVYDEIVVVGQGLPGSVEVENNGWITTQPVKNKALVNSLRLELDPGEAETLALAVEVGADLVLLDEKNGRQVAARLNLRVIGILGILVEAKKNNLIPDVKTHMDNLIVKAGFWINPKFYSQILQSTGENVP
jgi:uncharacterized protein